MTDPRNSVPDPEDLKERIEIIIEKTAVAKEQAEKLHTALLEIIDDSKA